MRPLLARLLPALPLVALAAPAAARPGLHPLAMATWDTTASSLGFAGSLAPTSGSGSLLTGSYYANFSSSSGNTSAQFGVHYVRLAPPEGEVTRNGAAGTATFVHVSPIGRRHANGLPMFALGTYIGAAPTALIGGSHNEAWFPIVIGGALPWTPAPAVTITPWVELGMGLSIDNTISPTNVALDPESVYNPETNELNITAGDVLAAIDQAVDNEVQFATSARAGLTASIHLGGIVDLNVTGAISHLGADFGGPLMTWVSAFLQFHWDDPMAAVLPPKPCPPCPQALPCPQAVPCPQPAPCPQAAPCPVAPACPEVAPPSVAPAITVTPAPAAPAVAPAGQP